MSLVNVREIHHPSTTVPLTSHEFHAELNQLTGIAAILTFPLDIEVVEAEEQEAKQEEERRKAEAEGTTG